MLELSKVNIHLRVSVLLFLLAVLLGLGFSFYVYRKTNPRVSNRLRYFLMALRAGAMVIAILILFEPILSLTFRRTQRPVIGVLVDTSASMSLVDRKFSREEEVKRILADPLFQKLADKYELKYFQFSDKISDPGIDSLKFDGDGTDIKRALEELKGRISESYLAGVILITDGAANLGENPARFAATYGVPIYPIAIGDPSEQKDLLICHVSTNQITYVNNRVPVDVTVKSSGFEGVKVSVTLKQEGVALDSKYLQLTGGLLESRVRLHYLPQKEGFIKYQLEVPLLEGEITALNNRKSFYVKVLKSRMKVLLIAGGPGPDFSFLKRTLISDENMELTALVEKKGGDFYQEISIKPEQLNQYDCFVLLNYPTKNSDSGILNTLKTSLDQDQKPLLFINGKGVDYSKLRVLRDYLPMSPGISRGSERLIYLDISSAGVEHPVVRLSDERAENLAQWKGLPPVYYFERNTRLLEGGQALAIVDRRRSGLPESAKEEPVIAIRRVGRRKSAAILAYGLWRWDLLMWGAGKTNEAYQRFWSNIIRWLVTREDTKLVRISPDKEIYRSGEKVSFTAQVYYEDYRPLDGAQVRVKIQEYEVDLSGIGDGKYEGTIQVLQGGDYRYTGEAFFKGRTLGEDEGKFSVGEFNLEFQDTRMREDLLRKMATVTNGGYYTPATFATIAQDLVFPPKQMIESKEWEIWNRVPILVVFIALLSLEWFLRKRKGML